LESTSARAADAYPVNRTDNPTNKPQRIIFSSQKSTHIVAKSKTATQLSAAPDDYSSVRYALFACAAGEISRSVAAPAVLKVQCKVWLKQGVLFHNDFLLVRNLRTPVILKFMGNEYKIRFEHEDEKELDLKLQSLPHFAEFDLKRRFYNYRVPNNLEGMPNAVIRIEADDYISVTS
jgi:hypothetical protein